MNDVAGMPILALILFAPWFLILAALKQGQRGEPGSDFVLGEGVSAHEVNAALAAFVAAAAEGSNG